MSALAEYEFTPRWVCWRLEVRNGRPTKVPYSPHLPGEAKSDDPKTWNCRSAAETRALRLVNGHGGGIGVVLGDLGDGTALGGVDLDTCRGEDGTFEPWAQQVIERLGSYAEVSPSLTGSKIFFRWRLEDLPLLRARGALDEAQWGRQFKRGNGKEHPPAIELYLSHRYFAVTEQRVKGAPDKIATVDAAALLWVLTEAGPAFAGKGKAESKSGRDDSRSGIAFRLGLKLAREGKTYQQMVDALRADPQTAAWAKEQTSDRQFQRIWAKAQTDLSLIGELTEDGVALALAERFKDQLRYCHHTGAWFEWTGSHWQREETKLAFSWARHTCRQFAKERGAANNTTMAKAATAAAVERFAQADRAFAVTSAIWDRDPMLLGTPGGTVDLRTGKLCAAAQRDFLTRTTAVAPAEKPDCPLWLRFLNDATGGDAGLIRFLQQWAGYCLTGDVREHALLFVYGPGGNGKTVWLRTMACILAGYAKNAAMETFSASQSDRHPTDLAMLRGARMVGVSETEEGRAWAEVRIKNLTGGDRISARFMRQDYFEYDPQFKLTVIGNHKPVLRNVDDAAKRRFNVVPFTRKPATPDLKLEHKLQTEWPGILRWMIVGCLDWQRNGLIRPQSVIEATATYFSEQDTLRQWIDDCCDTGPREVATHAALFKCWTDYLLANGEKPGTSKWFNQAMQKLGFEPLRHTPGEHAKRGWSGIAVRPVDTSDQWQNRE